MEAISNVDYEVVVVGGGPAGLSASLTLGRALRNVLLIDSGQYRNASASHMQNMITRDGTPPAEFRQVARSQIEEYPTVEYSDQAVVTVRKDSAPASESEPFELTLSDGSTVIGRRLILATGLVDELPAIDGLAELWGKGVYHCPYCHGYEQRDTRISVLLTDPMMAELALHLRRFSPEVTLCTNGETDLEESALTRLERQNVAIRAERIAGLITESGVLARINFDGGPPLASEALFAMSVFRQRSDLPTQLGCDLLPDGCVSVDEFAYTSVPGVFAAGDMAHRPTLPMPMPFVFNATASGAMAAIAADKSLVATDTAL